MRVATRLLKSACSLLFMAVLCAAFSGSWLHPNLAWSEVVLVKKSSAPSAIYYLGSINSEFHMNCETIDSSCKDKYHDGPVSDAVKSSYVNELRTKGVHVLEEKPSHGAFYEVYVSMSINELHSSPPIVPKRFACGMNGGIIRYGTNGDHKLMKELEFHNKPVEPINESASSLVRDCLKHVVPIVRKGIEAINPPRSKTTKQ